MKWTFVFLATGGLLVYAVIFAVHADREISGAEAHDDVEAIVVSERLDDSESTPQPNVEPADDPVAGEPLSLLTQPVAEPTGTMDVQRREWEGGAWQAGVRAYEQRDFENARLALEDAVEENEGIAYHHYLLGLSCLKLGDAEAAVVELERALELAPGHVRGLVNLGRAYLDCGELDTAREVVDEALDIDLEYADAWQVLGRVEMDAGNLEEAAAAFTKATDRDPAHAFAHNNLGYVRIQQERFEQAVPPLAEATRLRQDIPYFFNNLGVALERTDDLSGASAAYAKAEELGHPMAAAHLDRVEAVLLARGERDPLAGELVESSVAETDTVAAAGW